MFGLVEMKISLLFQIKYRLTHSVTPMPLSAMKTNLPFPGSSSGQAVSINPEIQHRGGYQEPDVLSGSSTFSAGGLRAKVFVMANWAVLPAAGLEGLS